MLRAFDTIVAPITAPGRAAVAAVRVSGPGALEVARRVFRSLPIAPEPRRAIYGRFAHGDDGLALPFEASGSYTGEPAVELFIHGSPTSVRLLVDGCVDAGARPAEPGEFTLRAFANGRLDLSQAEAVAEVVDATTAAHLKAAGAQLGGALARSLAPALAELESAIVQLEASLDFSEEIGRLDMVSIAQAIRDAQAVVAEARSWERPTLLMRDGLRVAILGQPNAGKSSLFNALIGADRAIVTDIPGTTRDVLEAIVDVHGIPVTLFDTAGLRDDADPIEAIGIQRAREAAKAAHTSLYVYDCALGLTSADRAILERLPSALIVASKADIPHEAVGHLEVSALAGLGLEELLRELVDAGEDMELPFMLNARHASCLLEAYGCLAEATAAACEAAEPDLILPMLYHADGQLRQVLGIGVAPDVIDQIFTRFCIGK